MSLDNINVVDAIGIENNTGIVVLNLFDPWDWEDQQKHLEALQAKLNAYFAFVESGEIYSAYPDAAGKQLRIGIVSRYPLPDVAQVFLKKAAAVASELNLGIEQRVH